MKNVIDGITFEKMLRSGYNNLCLREQEINDMNVFPVADGDTGANMRLTMENGLSVAKSNAHLGEYLKGLSNGMLFGARGNSGVILSQIFKGMYLELARCSIANPGEIRDSLIKAYRTAYLAVLTPVEGTILTVAREGIENIKSQIYSRLSVKSVWSMYLAEMRKSLLQTPELLPVLKDSGVLDSGAYGYITIVEGMVQSLYGNDVESVAIKRIEAHTTKVVPTQELFNADSNFVEGYCTEFILQLLNSKDYQTLFDYNVFVEKLNKLGNSIVCLQEESLIKVHIHTLKPALVIELAQEFGEFVTFKMENMEIQHNEHLQIMKKVPLASIAVVDGEGIENLYKDLGCNKIIQAGRSLNVSSAQLVDAIRACNADKILILPNDKNNLFAATQATSLIEADNVEVIPTKNMVEGYFALAMDIADEDDLELRVNNIKDGASLVKTIGISKAVKDYSDDDFSCLAGSFIASLDGKLILSDNDEFECLKNILAQDGLFEEKASMLVLFGKGLNEEQKEAIQDYLLDTYDELEINCIDGDQELHDILIGLI